MADSEGGKRKTVPDLTVRNEPVIPAGHVDPLSPIHENPVEAGVAGQSGDELRDLLESLRASEEKYRLLAEAMPQIVWTATADGHVDYCNQYWLDYSGLSLADTTDTSQWTNLLHPDDLERTLECWKAARSGGAQYQIEYRLRRASDQQYRWHLGRMSPIRDAHGAVIKWVGTAVEIHDRKQAEYERDQLLASERAARGEAERASRMKDEFMATLSHELRTPLNAILGYAQLLRRGSVDAETLEQGLETIERSAKTQAQLISDMLDVSRIISGKIRLDVKRVDLLPVVEAALDTIALAAGAKDIVICRQYEQNIRPVSGDPDRLQQVLWNLLSNAIKFTPAGGFVTIRLARSGGNIEVVVTDSGQGIKPELLPYVFDRFRQGDGSSTRQHGGLGLGLSIVRHIVELHGGTIRVESAGEGTGATFSLLLPIAKIYRQDTAVLKERQSSEPLEIPRLTGVRVLVVDDQPDARDLVRRVLEQSEAEVFTAEDAEEALARIAAGPLDVLICDLSMPGEDGFSLIRKLRKLPVEEGGNLPALALTALAGEDVQNQSLLAGYQVLLTKPVETPELLAVVANLAGRTEIGA